MHSARREQLLIDILNIVRPHALSTRECQFMARPEKRALVELLYAYGISISYDRVLGIYAQLGDATVSKYVEDGTVCPLQIL